MNKIEKKAANQLENEGWILVRGGAPDFLAYKKNAEGKITKVACFEVKSKSDVVRPIQEEQLKVLAAVGVESVVLRENYEGTFDKISIDSPISSEAADNFVNKILEDNVRKRKAIIAKAESIRLSKIHAELELDSIIEKENVLDSQINILSNLVKSKCLRFPTEVGKNTIKAYIEKHGFDCTKKAMERAFDRYYRKENDASRAFDSIQEMLKYKNQTDEEFEYEGKIAYAGGVVKSKLDIKGWNTEPEWVCWKKIILGWKKSNKPAQELLDLVKSFSSEDLKKFLFD